MQTIEVGQTFVEFYGQRGFSLLPSSSLLHPSVPMSFVMSAGLVQVETALDQIGKRNGHKYALVQRCFRYFDVDAVGNDAAHLSLFEMPAAFSFNALKKLDIVGLIWELLTSRYGIDPRDLWVTYFAGGTRAGHAFAEDDETRNAWLDVGMPAGRIVGLGVDDNLWVQGDGIEGNVRYRKAGPNTEIFFDRGQELACGPDCRPPCRCGRFVEFANSLFVKSEIDIETNRLRALAEPFLETVIGTERLAMILQGRESVFEIDALQPLMDAIRRFGGAAETVNGNRVKAERILADHVRALCFLVADGAPEPGKDGRSRLIKILIRRAVTYQILLGIEGEPLVPELVDIIVGGDQQKANLAQAHDRMLAFYTAEADRFEDTLASGRRRVERLLRQNGSSPLTGQQIVTLEKQHGMPRVLSEAMLQERGLDTDRAQYQRALEQWRRSVGSPAN